jgi:hypothetical protein
MPERIIAPVLAFHRELYARNHEDLAQHVEFARTLHASGREPRRSFARARAGRGDASRPSA